MAPSSPEGNSQPRRKIRSFVRREGRLTAGQARALQDFWPDYGIDYFASPLDLDACFGRRAPRVLDIGCGMGETTLALAARHPENDYLGVEVHRPGVGRLLRGARERDLRNLRVICHDAVEVIRHQLPDNSLDEVFILFPDPWPKKKHHKRRLVSAAFLASLLPKMKDHARLYLATDWEDLAGHLLETCDACPGLMNLAGRGRFAPRPRWRPLTKFEERGRQLGHVVYDLIYCLKASYKSQATSHK